MMTDTQTYTSRDYAAAGSKLDLVRGEIKRVVFGQDEAIELTILSLLSGGHMLLLGLPGLAKTRLVRALSKAMGLETKRVQCTPDLMPSDIIGAEILEEVDYGRRNFRFIQGPVFCQFLMVDEINRASPRTQSALLQAMEERNVTVTGREHTLPTPFHVLATQNPLEQEGTYPLPEAQLDRFLMRIEMSYPDQASEKKIIQGTMDETDPQLRSILYAKDLLDLQALVRSIPLSAPLTDSILAIIRAARPDSSSLEIVKDYVQWGPSPRAGRALGLAVRARAILTGRVAPEASDLPALIRPILGHRMALNYKARADGVKMEDVLTSIAKTSGGFR